MKVKLNLEGVVDFCVIAFMLYYFLLPSASINISTWLVLGCILLYTAYVVLISNNYRVRTLTIGYTVIVLFIALLYVLLTKSSSDLTIAERYITKFGQWFRMFFPILLFYRFTKLKSNRSKTLLLLFATLILAVVVYNSFSVLEENSYAARQWSEFDDIKNLNAVTYEYVYAIAALIPFVFWCFIAVKKLYIKIISLLVLAVCFSLLLAAQYTISIMLAVLGCLICFYRKYNSAILIIISVFIGIMLIFFLPTIFTWISTLFESETIAIRFKELAIFMAGGKVSAGGDVTSRLNVYKQCFEYFLKSPIIGNVSLPFDPHSTFLGVMCDFGIIGMIPIFPFIFTIHKRIYEIAGNYNVKNIFIPVHIVWVSLGFLNPVHAALPLNMIVWFLVPAMGYVFSKQGSCIKEV